MTSVRRLAFAASHALYLPFQNRADGSVHVEYLRSSLTIAAATEIFWLYNMRDLPDNLRHFCCLSELAPSTASRTGPLRPKRMSHRTRRSSRIFWRENQLEVWLFCCRSGKRSPLFADLWWMGLRKHSGNVARLRSAAHGAFIALYFKQRFSYCKL